MINKNLLNKKVIKALSIGLSTAMIMQPVASMAEEAPATETPDGFVVKVVEEKPVEEKEFFEETPDFFEEAEAVDELLDEAEFKETVAGAEAVLSFEVPVILNEVAAVIDDTQAEEKLADTEELVADAQDEITAKIDEVEEDLEEREKVIDNAKNLADEANAAAQKVQDDVDDADALLAEAEAAKTSAEAAAISEEIKDLADDAEAQAAIAEAKAEEAEAAIEEAKQMYEDAEAKYNEAVEYAAAKVEEANALLAEGTEDAKDAWIDAQRALNAARALQATTNFALKGAEAYVSTVEKELNDAKLELLQAQADLKQAAADKVSADLKVVAEGIDLVEAGVLLETAKGVVKLADANLEAKEKALQDLYDKKAAADAEVARLKKAYEDAKADEKTDKATLDRIQGEYNALVTALNAANSAISELEGQIETEKANLETLGDDLEAKKSATAAAQTAFDELTDTNPEKNLKAAEEAYKADPTQENLEALIKIMLEQNYDGEFTKSVNVDDNGQAVFIKDGNAAEGYIYTIDENGKVDVFEKEISQQNVRSDVYEAADENKYATAEAALAGISEEDIANGLYKAVGNGDAVEAVEGEEAEYTVKYSTEEEVVVKAAGTIEDGGYDWLNGDNYKKLSPDDLPEGAQIIVRSEDLLAGKIGELFKGGSYYYTYTYKLIPDGYWDIGVTGYTKLLHLPIYGNVWVDTSYYGWVCDQTDKEILNTDHVSLLYANDVYETQVVPHEFTGIKESELGNYPADAETTKTKDAVAGIAGQSETYSLQKLSAVEEKSGISKDEFEALTSGLEEGVDYIKTKTTRLVSEEQVVPGSEEVFNGQAKNFDFAQYVGKEGYKVLYDGKEILRAGSKDGKYYLAGEEKETQISNGNGKLVVLNLSGTGSTVIPAVYEDIYDLTLFTNSQYVISGDDDSDFNQSASKLIDEIDEKDKALSAAKSAQQGAQKLYDDKGEEIKNLEEDLTAKKTLAGDKQTEVDNKKTALDEADAAEKEALRVLAEAKAAKEAAEKAYNGYYNNGIKGYFTGITIVPSSYELDVKAAKAKVTQAEIELGLAQAAKKLAQDNYDESVKEFNAAVKASEQALVELVKAELRRDADILVVAGKEIKLAGAKSAYVAAKNANDYALRLKADAKAARDAAKAAYDAYKALSVEDISAEELAAAKAAYEAAKLDYDFKLAAAKEATKLAEGAKKDYEDALEQVSKLAEQERLAAEEAARLAAEEAARLAAEEAARREAEEAARLAAETNTAEVPAAEEVIAIATTGAATTTTTTTTTAQVVEIEDEDTALAEAPEEEEEVVLSIDEEGTPLAGDIEYLDLEEEEVPQAPAPEGSMSWWWLFIIAALGATGFEMYRRYNLKKTAKANKNNK